jgi:hypothetical protein
LSDLRSIRVTTSTTDEGGHVHDDEPEAGEPTTRGTVIFFAVCAAVVAGMAAAAVISRNSAVEVTCVGTAAATGLLALAVVVGLVRGPRRTRPRAGAGR